MWRAVAARQHIGATIFVLAGVEDLLDTELGVVAKIGNWNIVVEVTDDGWVLRLLAVAPMTWTVVHEWALPAILVPQAFLALSEQVSSHT